MKKFKKVEVNEVLAVQYGTHEEAQELLTLCTKDDYDGQIHEVPSDLMGKPKDAFHALKTDKGYSPIKEGDWIVKKDNQLFVIENGVFQLLFQEM